MTVDAFNPFLIGPPSLHDSVQTTHTGVADSFLLFTGIGLLKLLAFSPP